MVVFPSRVCGEDPLPVLILLGASVVTTTVRRLGGAVSSRQAAPGRLGIWALRDPSTWVTPACLFLFPTLYAVSSLFSTVNIGYRHLLPLLPFVYIGAAQVVSRLSSNWAPVSSAARLGIAVLYGWLAIGTVRVSSDYLTFFNLLTGGSGNGYHFLVDSNLDWGQNLWDLKRWMDTHSRDHVFYAHYSPADPQVYGVNATFLPPDPRAATLNRWNPEPGLYAIGATVLQGPYAPDLNTFAWFRGREPVAKLGNALFIYEVPAGSTPDWAVVCLPTLSDEVIATYAGTADVRVMRPDCGQTEVYSPGPGSGLYVVPGDLAPPLAGDLAFQMRDASGQITSRIYRVDTPPKLAIHDLAGQYDLEGPLSFLGYALEPYQSEVEAGDTLILRTVWDVVAIPDRPLSLMAHGVDSDGRVVALEDGLGYPIEQWRPGDRLIQIHRLQLPATWSSVPSSLTLQTGAYWLDSLERWPVDRTNDAIILTTVPTGKVQ